MTPEEYLRAKGWVEDQWSNKGIWLDRWAQPLENQSGYLLETAVAIQVERETQCLAFERAWRKENGK